ncbi:MAG TPA: DinB family protein [Anaerolineales bacterium]|nr:DinB family protein [Anaerolineales bacterium]
MATRAQILRKEQTLSSLKETRQNILAEASKLSKRQWDQVFLGSWSIKDLVAHLIGWDDTNLEAIQNVLAGKLPAFYEYRDPDWRTYNAMLVKKHKVNSSKEILTKAKDSQEKLIQFLQTVPPEQFNKDFGVRFRGYKVTIQRLLEAERGDEQTHLQQIMDFVKEAK